MADRKTSITDIGATGANSGDGNSPEVDESSLEASNRVVTSVSQLVGMGDTDIKDARKLILAATRITAKKQGAPPYDPAKLKQQGKSGSKRNISTRFLQKELNRAAPRFFMPLLTASTMTAAELPAGWPGGQEKTQFYRDTMTRAFRSWRKNDMFWRGLNQEVCDFGYGFAVWTDKYEWRPHLARMDRGFVPKGTEVMDDKLARFTLKWDYRPDELLKIARDATEAGSEKWKKEAVAEAVDKATQPTKPGDMSGQRKWEELIREQVVDYSTSRSQKMIECRHQWVLEYSGKVSHYIVATGNAGDNRLLFEDLDAYEKTDNVVIPKVFGYGDGTIQGSLGVGSLLYDLAAQVEKVRCDGMDNLLNSNKARLQVASAKDVASAQLVINDTMIIACGATFAQNIGGISGDPKGYMALDDKMTQWAQEIVGSYLPPMPSQASKAATDIVEQQRNREQAIQEDNLETSLKQDALIIAEMSRRMLDPDSDDKEGNETREYLLGKAKKNYPPSPVSLTEEEIDLLVNQPVVQSVSEFTQYAASQRGAFAGSVMNNPLFKQKAAARYMAGGVPNASNAFVDSIVVAEGDNTEETASIQKQLGENTTMFFGTDVPVLTTDNHWIHIQTMLKPLEQAIMQGLIPAATAGLKHMSAHFAAGSAFKTIPPDQINTTKATIAKYQQALEEKQKEVAAQQAQQQPQLQALPGGMAS